MVRVQLMATYADKAQRRKTTRLYLKQANNLGIQRAAVDQKSVLARRGSCHRMSDC